MSETIQGLDAFIDFLARTQSDMPQVVAKELYQFAEEVMGDSKQVVPVETGALMNTGKVTPPTFTSNGVEVTLGYGDESVDYALIVHEELQSRSGGPIKWSRPGSGPKYLENPLKAKEDQLAPRIKDAMMRAFFEE